MKHFLPKLCLLNARSLLPKVDELRAVTSVANFDVICVSETWLSPAVDDSLLNIQNFSLYRHDRTTHRGGGCAVYVKNTFASEVFECDLSIYGIECCVVRLLCPAILVFCIYIPPNTRSDSLRELRDFLVQKVDTASPSAYMFAGDFNRFDVKGFCDILDLTDIVTKPTRNGSILDHILMSRELRAAYCDENVNYDSPIGTADHKIVTATPVNYVPRSSTKTLHCVYDYRQSNVNHLLHTAYGIDWTAVTKSEDVNEQWTNLLACVHSLIGKCIPRNEIFMSSDDKSWLTPLIKLMINERWRAFREKNWPVYVHLKTKVKKSIMTAKRLWAEKLKSKTMTGAWNVVNQVKGQHKRSFTTTLVTKHGSNQAVANLVASHISSLFSKSCNCDVTTGFTDDHWSIQVSEVEVQKLLRRSQQRKAPGCDGVPTRIYVLLSEVIARPLARIIECSVNSRTFPDGWKNGVVIPIPKNKSLHSASNIRPLTLYPLPSKLCEKIVKQRLDTMIEAAVSETQHGFRQGASTTTAVVKIMDSALRIRDESGNFGVAVVSFDFSRAFDCLEHNLLINKLAAQAFPRGFLLWLQSYLGARTSKVRVNDAFSPEFAVQKGVPQGTVLGPSLFSCFTGDLVCFSETSTMVNYADDTNIIIPVRNNDGPTILASIQCEVDHIERWCERNRLRLNREKSCFILNAKNPICLPSAPPIPQREFLKILGVTISSKLDWSVHVSDIQKRANKQFHAMKLLKPLLTQSELHIVYTATIRSLLEYCCPVFVSLPRFLSERLEKIDKRAHRIIYGESASCACSCSSNNIERRRINLSRTFLRSIEKNVDHLLRGILPERLPRTGHYSLPYCRTHKYLHSFMPYMLAIANSEIV